MCAGTRGRCLGLVPPGGLGWQKGKFERVRVCVCVRLYDVCV